MKKMIFSWKKFCNHRYKMGVHCNTLSETKQFCELLNRHGLTWWTGDSYLEGIEDNWQRYKDRVVFNNQGSVTCLENHLPKRIYEFSELIPEDFKFQTVKQRTMISQKG